MRFVMLLVVMLCLLGCASGDAGPNAVVVNRLNGGGSTFLNPLMSKWSSVYAREKGVEINYQSIGSGAGVTRMTDMQLDFGCSDAPLNAEQTEKARAAGGEVLHLPLVMGGVVPVYNLPSVTTPLQFSGPLLADIFLRKVKRWNDAKIKEQNPKTAEQLPDMEIAVVRRAEPSGTTYILADYLARVSPAWKEQMAVSTALKWPDDTTGAKGNDGVAGQVKNNPGTIGYVELIYAVQNNIAFGAVRNRAGEYVRADLDSVTAAATHLLTEIPDDLRYSLADAPGSGSYPISGTVWAVVYAKQPADRASILIDFFRWATSGDGGQSLARELHYAPLPLALSKRVADKIQRIVPAS